MQQKKIFLIGAVSLLITASLITALLWLLGFGDPTSEFADETRRASRNVAAIDSDIAQGASATSAAAAEESATEREDASSEEAELQELQPLLTGIVTGEEGEIEGARVLVFAVREVERLLRRLERFDPGSSLPDIPRLVDDVREELERFKQTGRSTVTAEDGRYAFFELAPGAYFVLALAPGHVFRYGDVASVATGRTEELDLFLHGGATIGGRVVNSSGEGLPAVTVTAEYRPPGMGSVGKIVQKLLKYVNGEFLKGPFQKTTDAEGRFHFDSLPPGDYDLLAEKEGFPDHRVLAITTGTSEAVILLQPGVSIDGVLVDSNDLPVPDQVVRLSPQMEPIALPFPGVNEFARTARRLIDDPAILAISAADGSFRFPSVGPGRYTLEIQNPGFLPLRQPIRVRAGEPVPLGQLHLDRGASLTGFVRDVNGVPLSEASVSAYSEGLTMFTLGSAIQDLTTGRVRVDVEQSGAFRIGGLVAGTYRVIGQAPGHGAAVLTSVATDGEPVELTLLPGVPVAGRVIDDATGEPITGATVRAGRARTTTDAEGRFVLDSVSPRNENALNPFGDLGRGGRRRSGGFGASATDSAGTRPGAGGTGPTAGGGRVRVHARHEGYQDERVRVELSAATPDVDIRLRAKPRIHGILLDPEGEPLPGGLLRLVPGDARMPFLSDGKIFVDASVSDLEGHFVLDAPSDSGRFTVLAAHPFHATTPSDVFYAASHGEDDPIQVQMSLSARIHGVVHGGSEPIGGARVRLSRARERSPQERIFMGLLGLPREGKEMFSREDGTFDYGKVLPGKYQISVEVAGFADTWSDTFEVVAGDERQVDVRLDPGGAVKGIVVDGDGEPLPGVRVRVLQPGGLDERLARMQRALGGAFKMAVSTADGRFEIPGLPAASYTLIAQKKGYIAAKWENVSPLDEDDLVVTLAAAARLRGRVVDAATNVPLPQYELRLEREDGGAVAEAGDSPFGRAAGWTAVREGDGRFFRDGLAAGFYRVEARASSYAPVATLIELRAGEEPFIDLALETAGRLEGRILDAQTGEPISGCEIAHTKFDPDAEVDFDELKERVIRDPGREVSTFFRERASRNESRSDASGVFSLDGFAGDTRAVIASHPGYAPRRMAPLTVPPGGVDRRDILLTRGLAVGGAVTDLRGRGVSGSFVLARGVSSTNHFVRKGVQSDAKGQFEVRGLPAGLYVLIAQRRGGDPVTLTVEVSDSSLDGLALQLSQAGS